MLGFMLHPNLHESSYVREATHYNFFKERLVQVVMSNLEQIEAAILALPSNEFEKLRLWFLDLDYERWDEQIEQDIEDGKLEALAQEAIAEFEAGHYREI